LGIEFEGAEPHISDGLSAPGFGRSRIHVHIPFDFGNWGECSISSSVWRARDDTHNGVEG
jgi:hypothetical protein